MTDRPILRPRVVQATLAVEILWLIEVVYLTRHVWRIAGSSFSLSVQQVVGVWAAPAIAFIAVAWLVEQGLMLLNAP